VQVNTAAPQTRNSRPFGEDGRRPSPAGSTGHLGSKICNLSGSQGLSCLLSLFRSSVSLPCRNTRTKTAGRTTSTAATVCPYRIPAFVSVRHISPRTAIRVNWTPHATAMASNSNWAAQDNYAESQSSAKKHSPISMATVALACKQSYLFPKLSPSGWLRSSVPHYGTGEQDSPTHDDTDTKHPPCEARSLRPTSRRTSYSGRKTSACVLYCCS
jgi:hypothetical protein